MTGRLPSHLRPPPSEVYRSFQSIGRSPQAGRAGATASTAIAGEERRRPGLRRRVDPRREPREPARPRLAPRPRGPPQRPQAGDCQDQEEEPEAPLERDQPDQGRLLPRGKEAVDPGILATTSPGTTSSAPRGRPG